MLKNVPEYLEKWRTAFDLFGDGPRFLQLPSGEGLEFIRATDGLLFTRASGNNTNLHDKAGLDGPRPNPPEWLALNLIAFQLFARGGTIGTATINRRTTERIAIAAPLSEGTPLVSYIIGKTVLETVLLNMIPFARLGRTPPGRPVWETMPTTVAEEKEIARSYLGRLVPLSRAIRLADGGARMACVEWIRYPKIPAGRDPWLSVVAKKGGAKKTGAAEFVYRRIDPSVAAWRSVPSVISTTPVFDGKSGGALNIENLRDINRPALVQTGGLIADQAKIRGIGSWAVTVSTEILGSVGYQRYIGAVDAAESMARRLYSAAKRYAKTTPVFTHDFKGLAASLQSSFWSELARREPMLAGIAGDGILEAWQRAVGSAGETTFDRITQPGSAISWKMWAFARAGLRGASAAAISNHLTTERGGEGL